MRRLRAIAGEGPMMKAQLVAALLAATTVGTENAVEQTVTGYAQVLDGSSVRIDGNVFRLWGIAVPGHDRLEGLRATIALFRILDGKIASCHSESLDRAGSVGKCEA